MHTVACVSLHIALLVPSFMLLKPMKHGASNKLPSTRQYQMRNHAGGAPRGIPESATTPWFPRNPPDVSHIAAFI